MANEHTPVKKNCRLGALGNTKFVLINYVRVHWGSYNGLIACLEYIEVSEHSLLDSYIARNGHVLDEK